MGTDSQVRQRYTWMDLLRGAAVLLVVQFHATVLLGEDTVRPLHWLSNAAGSFRIPTLMFMSGLLLPRSLAKPVGTYSSGKVRAVVWPWLLWSAFMLPILGWDNAVNPLWWIAGPDSHTWFLSALVMLYAVALIARRVPPAVVSLAMLGVALLIQDPSQRWLMIVDGTAWWGFFFFAGATMWGLLPRVLGAPWWLAAIGFTISTIFAIYAIKAGAIQMQYPVAAVISMIGVTTSLWFAARIPRVAPVRMVEWFGRRSIVTYLAHWPVMWVLLRTFDLPGGWLGFVLLFVPSVALSALLIQTWPLSCYLFEWPRRRSVGSPSGPDTRPADATAQPA